VNDTISRLRFVLFGFRSVLVLGNVLVRKEKTVSAEDLLFKGIRRRGDAKRKRSDSAGRSLLLIVLRLEV